eukprot:gene1193-709_t
MEEVFCSNVSYLSSLSSFTGWTSGTSKIFPSKRLPMASMEAIPYLLPPTSSSPLSQPRSHFLDHACGGNGEELASLLIRCSPRSRCPGILWHWNFPEALKEWKGGDGACNALLLSSIYTRISSSEREPINRQTEDKKEGGP